MRRYSDMYLQFMLMSQSHRLDAATQHTQLDCQHSALYQNMSTYMKLTSLPDNLLIPPPKTKVLLSLYVYHTFHSSVSISSMISTLIAKIHHITTSQIQKFRPAQYNLYQGLDISSPRRISLTFELAIPKHHSDRKEK